MKNQTYVVCLFLLFCISTIFAQQTIRIPDVAFEEALIDLDIDTNGLNGNILVSDANYVVNLNIHNPENNKLLPNVHSKIKDLTGIEHFKNLKRLVCFDNEITKMDLSKNTQLTFLNCSQNKINHIDVSNSPDLFFLSCDSNKLTTLKLGVKTKLTELYCNSNKLTELNIKDCAILGNIDVSDNNITNIIVSDAIIKAIPEAWYKDEKSTYTTSAGKQVTHVEKIKVQEKEETIVASTENSITNTEKSPSSKINDENFKRLLVKEFEKSVLDESYLAIKKEEIQQKYNISKNELNSLLAEYSELIKFKNKEQ